MDVVLDATVQVTEETVVNALIGAKTMSGADGYILHGIPHGELKKIVKNMAG